MNAESKCIKMNKLLILMIFMMGLFFSSCREEKSDPGYLAGIAAKGYYDLLLEGKYKEFVDGYNQPYRLPDGYQEQLLMNAKMFVEQQQDDQQHDDRRRGLFDKAALHVIRPQEHLHR